MTKIVHMTSVHGLHDTRVFYQECRTLAREGFEVVLIVPRDERDVSEFRGVRIRSIPRPANRLLRVTSTGYRIFRAAREEDADLYHFHDPELLPWARCLRLLGKRVVFDMHENFRGALLTKGWIPRPMRRPAAALFGGLERRLLGKMPVVFAERSYPKHFPASKDSTIVLNLPDVLHLSSVREDKFAAFTAGYMGGISEIRGSLAMVKAVRMLSARGPGAGLHFVGPVGEDHKRALLGEARSGAEADIVFHGRMIPEDGWRIMARCHAGLAVLQSVPNYIESYPTKMFEYMALGLPVVVSDFPLYRDVVERVGCGFCVDPADPERIAEALLYLSRNSGEAVAMGARGREAVIKEFNWSTEARKLVAFYRSVLSR